MPPMNAARRRAMRAVLSALAGGGLTAASLGGPLPGRALAAGGFTHTTAESSTTPESPPGSGGETSEGQSTTTTTTTPTTPTPPTTPTTPTTTATTPTTSSGTATTPPPAAPAPAEAPTVVLQRRQNKTPRAKPNQSATGKRATPKKTAKSKGATGPNNVALSPELIAAQAAALASSEASVQALGFYRIPLFLLPIYKAAAVQYGVPWQVLAAINEIETNYGTDLSVSSAGAVGWMQFMPSTWLQYGVDALNAGYADPYNPVDAVFAAARYLRAAGAATDLRGAILAYNHSTEYVDSVLLRAKLISAYPRSVIATLTGLIDGRLPVTGKRAAWGAPETVNPGSSTATANAARSGEAAPASGSAASASQPGTPGSHPAPTPAAAARAAAGGSSALQLVDLTSNPDAKVVAVQNGRVTALGHSRKLGRYLVLRDIYGDVFTYAGLGSIAPDYTLPKAPSAHLASPLVEVASRSDPAPSQPASAGFQSPLTLQVKAPKRPSVLGAGGGQAAVPAGAEGLPSGPSKVRLFARPGNPDARAAAVADAAARAQQARAERRLPLRRGSVVASGTVLGSVTVSQGASTGHLRFAVRPAGDPSTVDPGPVLANWAQLQTALHPQGAKAQDALLGATASDVFLLSKAELQRTVLSDPGVTVYACGRHDIAAGMIDKRVLAVLAFLSRSGLRPTVSALHCAQSPVTASGAPSAAFRGDAVEISAINGTPIAGHQGTGTITDLAIRTLLTLPSEFLPDRILSLMRYPGGPSTHASSGYWNRVRLEFPPAAAAVVLPPAAAGAAHSAKSAKAATVPVLSTGALSSVQWNQLITRIGALPVPTVARKPTSSAIPDPKRP